MLKNIISLLLIFLFIPLIMQGKDKFILDDAKDRQAKYQEYTRLRMCFYDNLQYYLMKRSHPTSKSLGEQIWGAITCLEFYINDEFSRNTFFLNDAKLAITDLYRSVGAYAEPRSPSRERLRQKNP